MTRRLASVWRERPGRWDWRCNVCGPLRGSWRLRQPAALRDALAHLRDPRFHPDNAERWKRRQMIHGIMADPTTQAVINRLAPVDTAEYERSLGLVGAVGAVPVVNPSAFEQQPSSDENEPEDG